MSVVIITGADEGVGYGSAVAIAQRHELPLRFVAFLFPSYVDPGLQQQEWWGGIEGHFAEGDDSESECFVSGRR